MNRATRTIPVHLRPLLVTSPRAPRASTSRLTPRSFLSSPRFSSSLNQANGIRQLFSRSQRTRVWKTTLLLLTGFAAGVAVTFTPYPSSGFEDWPEEVRESLRAGLAAYEEDDLEASSAYFLKAWIIIGTLPRENLTQDLLMKMTGLALTLGTLLEDESPTTAYSIYETALALFPLYTLPLPSSNTEPVSASVHEWWSRLGGAASANAYTDGFVETLMSFLDQTHQYDETTSNETDKPIPWENQELLRALALSNRLGVLAEQNSNADYDVMRWHMLSTKMVVMLWEFDTEVRTSGPNEVTATRSVDSELPVPDWAIMDDQLCDPILSFSRYLRKMGPDFCWTAGILAILAQVMLLKAQKEEYPVNERCKLAQVSNFLFDMMYRVPQAQDIGRAFQSSQTALAFCESCVKLGFRDAVCDREYPTALLNHAEILEYKGEIDSAIYFYEQARLNAEKVGLQAVYPQVDEALRRLEKPPEPPSKTQYYRTS